MIPQPGSKPEFLADLRVVDPSPIVAKTWDALPSSEVVLEGYTRDGWAWKPGKDFQNVTVESTDGRNKLSGFLSYLQQRQKACFGRFGTTGLWVVSYVQPKQQGETAKNRMECRISHNFTKIPGCNLKPRAAKQQPQQSAAKPIKKSGGGGLLGKLVAGQKRTNQHMMDAVAPSARSVAQQEAQVAKVTRDPNLPAPGMHSGGVSEKELKSASQVMMDFRQKMEQKMLDFDIAPEDVLKVPLSLPEYTSSLSPEDKPKVTMEILKYMVYEAAEEVNEEWVAHKEPSEFMDEVVIAVYKEGAAPPEVLEEINKGEMPDEVRGQQRAVQEERARQMNQAEQKKARELELQAHNYGFEGGDAAALNQNKRDRRTIEDYEREKKRGKTT